MCDKLFHTINEMTLPCESVHKRREILIQGVVFYFKYIIVSFIILFTLAIIIKRLGIEVHHFEKGTNFTDALNSNTIFGVLMISCIGPFTEEVLFRIWLSFRRIHIAISVFLLTYWLITVCLPIPNREMIYGFINKNFTYLWYYKLLVSIVLASCVFVIRQETLDKFKSKWGHFVVFASALVFACVHLSNYTFPWYAFPLVTFMCLPQFTIGIVITYYRLRLGFFYGLIFHSIHNFIPLYFGHHEQINNAIINLIK